MSLLFQNPLWLLGTLAAVPLLAHLFSRTRPRRRDFPSLRLLREALRHVTRVRRPRDRWLLILRTLAMLALVLAFLQPWLLSRFVAGSGAAKTSVLIVDVSASMAYADGTRTRLAQAASAAEDVLATLPGNSKANVIWVQAHAASVLPEPGPNLDFLRGALRQATARPEPGDVAGAFALALKQLAAGEGERELLVISDFQKTAWQGINLETPANLRLTRIAVGHEDAANVALAGLAVEPARPVAGQDARLVCRVRNFSAEPRRVTVFAEAGESRLSQAVEAAAWSETLAVMPMKFAAEGLVPLKASLTEDRFPGDDVRYGLAEVRGALQVGVAGAGDDATARVWARAAAALDGVTVRPLTLEQLEQPGRLDVLFIAGWNGRASGALADHLKRGGALVIQPAEGLDLGAVRAWLGLPAGSAPEQPLAAEVRDAPGWSLRVANEEHPVFALFSSGAFGDPANARFRCRLAAPAFLTGKPLLAFDDDRPALAILDFRPDAAIAWWNLDLGASDWPSRTAFLPFFGEFLRHLGQRTGAQTVRLFEPGDPLRFDLAAALDPADVRLVDERDQAIRSAAESPRTPGRLVSESAAAPGSYRWMAQGGILDRAVVNFPETESDLRRLSDAELQQTAGALISDTARSRIRDLREGQPLWPWCLGAAALLLLAEGLCLWRIPANAESGTLVPAETEKTRTLTTV
ncbi:MAG: hypothetical protein QOE70_2577 [Chthoniobacter sp.]|jgi:hypothetical protein|nr:hypothetical protein [Chthoniobacter sp.]